MKCEQEAIKDKRQSQELPVAHCVIIGVAGTGHNTTQHLPTTSELGSKVRSSPRLDPCYITRLITPNKILSA